MTPPTTATSTKRRTGAVHPRLYEWPVMVLVISALLPAALAVAVALWRQGQVPFILLLDVFDLQFVTQELTASLAVIVVAMMSSWASRRQSIPNQESLLSLLWRRVWIVAFLVFVLCVVVSIILSQISIV